MLIQFRLSVAFYVPPSAHILMCIPRVREVDQVDDTPQTLVFSSVLLFWFGAYPFLPSSLELDAKSLIIP